MDWGHSNILFDFYKVPFIPEDFIENKNCCFICGQIFKKLSREHLFPKWLLGDTNSYDERLTLPNRTRFFFRKMVIPCCESCNGIVVSNLDNKAKSIFEKSCKNISDKEKTVLFQWITKITSGLFLKSSNLRSNIRDPNSESLTTKDHLRSKKYLFALAKSIKYKVTFTNFNPYSLFLFEYDDSKSGELPFLFSSNYNYPTFAFAYKKIALIISIGDDGEIKDCFEPIRQLEFSTFDYPKLLENFCGVLTAHHLKNNKYGYLNIQSPITKELRISKFVIPGREEMPNFQLWDKGIYKRYFDFYKNFC